MRTPTSLPQRHPTPLVAGLCLLALIGVLLGWPSLHALDQSLMAAIQHQRSAGLDHLMVVITRLGDFRTLLVLGISLVSLLLLTRQWRAGLFAAAVLLGTGTVNSLLKLLFARARPDVLLEPLTSFSLPSGHTAAAFAFFLTVGVLAGRGQTISRRLGWLLLASLPAIAIAVSRIYLGVHWPTDILAGMLLASTLCAACLMLTEWRAPIPALARISWALILPACLMLFAVLVVIELPLAVQRYAY